MLAAMHDKMRTHNFILRLIVITGTFCVAGCSFGRNEEAGVVQEGRPPKLAEIDVVVPTTAGRPVADIERVLGEPIHANPGWSWTNGVLALTQYYEKDGFFFAVTSTGNVLIAVQKRKLPEIMSHGTNGMSSQGEQPAR
jgi:hypothetical protein